MAGYWGGFSGDVDGETFGFLSPLFDGDDFHGKAVQVYADFAFLKESVPQGDLCPWLDRPQPLAHDALVGQS